MLTTAQMAVMDAARVHGFIAQKRATATSCSPDLFAGIDGRRPSPPFRWSTVDALVRAGWLVWISRRNGRNGRWVAALARVNAEAL